MRKIFIDCGASDGGTVERFRRLYPRAEQYEIHAFEPDKRFPVIPSVNFYRDAIWVEDGVVDFYLGLPESSSLIQHKTTGELDTQHPKRVYAVNFSRFIQQFPRHSVVLKLDIEGAEYAVLGKMISEETIHAVRELHVDWHWNKIGMSERRHLDLIEQLPEIPIYDLSKSKPEFLENYP